MLARDKDITELKSQGKIKVVKRKVNADEVNNVNNKERPVVKTQSRPVKKPAIELDNAYGVQEMQQDIWKAARKMTITRCLLTKQVMQHIRPVAFIEASGTLVVAPAAWLLGVCLNHRQRMIFGLKKVNKNIKWVAFQCAEGKIK